MRPPDCREQKLLIDGTGSGGTLDPGNVCLFDGEAVYIDGDDDDDGENVVTRKVIFFDLFFLF